jgi:hypothetical protein
MLESHDTGDRQIVLTIIFGTPRQLVREAFTHGHTAAASALYRCGRGDLNSHVLSDNRF